MNEWVNVVSMGVDECEEKGKIRVVVVVVEEEEEEEEEGKQYHTSSEDFNLFYS